MSTIGVQPQQTQQAVMPSWPAGYLHIAALLSNGDATMRAQIAALYAADPQPSEGALRQELAVMLIGILRSAAAAYAQGLGCDAHALLRFASPHSCEPCLAGRNATLHRLDRCWNGPIQYSLRAHNDFAMQWPAPIHTSVLALNSPVLVNGARLGDHECRPLRVGGELRMGAHAFALVHRTAISVLLDAAADAALDLNELFGGLSGDVITTHTPAGPLSLDTRRNLVSINERVLRLNDTEVAVLRALLRNPGVVTPRESLNGSAGLDGGRTLDRMMLSLRNKLGDGVISTVYGVGYVLESEA